MKSEETVKFLAQLVHRGLLDGAAAQRALATPDAREYLIAHGVLTAAQWDEWLDTNAGTRPKLARYELLEELGEGGEARVFRARDRTTDEVVALKVLKSELSNRPAVVRRFIAEAKLLIDLECPNIVKGRRVAREGDVFFCAMELIDGESLQERLDHDGPLSEDDALDVVRQVANALAYLHERNCVHRDVKPGNLMRDRGGRVALIDLGFAIRGDDEVDSETTAGTAHYVSPEQARGHGDLDVRADIYSLGATLYHLLTGSLPFSGETSEEIVAKQVLEALSGEEIRSMDLSPQAHYLIEKMMAKDKGIRFQDPRELAREVDGILQQRAYERSVEASRPRLGTRRARPNSGARRRKRR
ncbi:MAG: serine/threonine protein kinase [Planctomycetes bacterium]|nr:serine/threonine protein kinase [Planctomycetota bacterium]